MGLGWYFGAMDSGGAAAVMFHQCNYIYLDRTFLIDFLNNVSNNALKIKWVNTRYDVYDTTELINIYKDRIESKINATFPNIYSKTEVDQKIAEAGGGGGTTDYNQLTNKPKVGGKTVPAGQNHPVVKS